MAPGDLQIDIADRAVTIDMIGGETWTFPVGPHSLIEHELEHADRPAPEQLTNALGIVSDHLDDVLREAPIVASAEQVTAVGPHAEALARVELGANELDGDHELRRPDADDVFRTLVAEPIADRRHNPGLREDETETIIGTCCVVLAVMRRLELDSLIIGVSDAGRA